MFGSHRTDNEALVTQAMQELANAPHDASRLPDPSFIWWKAQFLRRLDAEREATAPLDVGDHMHIGAAVLGAVALGGVEAVEGEEGAACKVLDFLIQ